MLIKEEVRKNELTIYTFTMILLSYFLAKKVHCYSA